MKTETKISKFCEECLSFRSEECAGSIPENKNTLFGQPVGQKPSGISFCKDYTFDERLYKFPDGSGKPDSFEVVRKRQIQKDIDEIQKQINEETYDVVDIGMNLTSKDFEGLI